MYSTIFTTPIIKTLLHWFALSVLKIFGWHIEGHLPDYPKYVLVAAPHTSNWDFIIVMLLALALRANLFWMGKSNVFRWPFDAMFKWLGGISTDRTKSSGMVAQVVQKFDENEKLAIVISPEGTRKKVTYWKTGFYHIAQGAKVPIVLGYLDYHRKAGGIGPAVLPSGDIEADLKIIQAFYADIVGRHPHKTDTASIRIEGDKE
jgi:1-acyl-sn-glycerol-3-phosphate acyltransferase